MLSVMLWAVTAPPHHERGPLYMEQLLAAIHQGNPARLPIRLVLGEHDGSVALFCQFPPELRAVVEGQLYAHYPDCHLEQVQDNALEKPAEGWIAHLDLRGQLFPIRSYPEFEDRLNRVIADPVGALLSSLVSEKRSELRSRIEIDVRPASPRRVTRAMQILRRLESPFFVHHPRLAVLYADWALSPAAWLRALAWLLATVARRRSNRDGGPQVIPSPLGQAAHAHRLETAQAKLRRHLFEARIRLIVSGNAAPSQSKRKLREMAGAFGQFSVSGTAEFRMGCVRLKAVAHDDAFRHGFLLSSEELATLWHPASLTVRSPRMHTVLSRELEPPVLLPGRSGESDLAVLGRVKFRSRKELVGIGSDDRRRHLALIGKTGMGKSALLQNLLLSDMQAGRGVALIDPHGDLAEAVLACVPSRRTNDVVLLDAADTTQPVAFNPLYCTDAAQRPLVAAGVLSAFKKLFADSWGPRMEHIFRNALLALLEVPGATLVSVLPLLTDQDFRRSIHGRISDPVVRTFWEREFAGMPKRLQAEAVAPIQNKVGQFVSNPLVRQIIGQRRSTLDLRRIIDEGCILIVNLSKGWIGDDASMLLGSLLVTGLEQAAMSRADQMESDRRDFHLYVDEFQNFATESFATLLSEARKYRLTLTLANQYLAQMDEAVRSALFGNVGTLVSFAIGAEDAEAVSEQLAGDVQPQDLIALPQYAAYVRLLVNGLPSRPFSMETLPPSGQATDPRRAEIVRRLSRRRYCRPAAEAAKEVEQALAM
jgi:TraM recognition site of TraD and TraG/Helicase HerA, central domain